MPIELDQAFISYTSDLEEECDAAIDVCRRQKVFAFSYKDVAANKDRPIDLILEELQRSDIYLGILGGKHGTEYPPPEGRSIVQFEYESFVEHKRSHAKHAYQIGIYPKVLPDDKIDPKQLLFRKTISSFENGNYIGMFDTIPKLREEISVTLGNWKGHRQNARNHQEEPDKARVHRVVPRVAMTIVIFAVLVTVVCTIFALGITSNMLATMLVCVAWSILLCWVVTRIY